MMASVAVATKPSEVPEIPEDRTEVITRVTVDPSLALRHADWFTAYYAALEADVVEHVPNVKTETGRDQIKALAFRVVKARTGIEGERKRTTENWRKLTESVNKAGKLLREKLEALEERARKPLTEWQAREDARKADIDEAIGSLRSACVVTFDDTAASVAERLAWVRGINDLSAERFGDRQDEAQNWYDQAVAALTEAHARLVKSEAEAAELAELRERQRLADEAELVRVRDEEAKARIRQAEENAAERERLRAGAEAEERIAAVQREAQAEARREIDEAERQLAEERRQREAEQRERDAEERARQAREQDEAHRRAVNSAIKDALVEHAGLGEKEAKRVAVALIKGMIPHCRVEY